MKHGVYNGLAENMTWEQRPGGEEGSHLDVWEEHTSWHMDLRVRMCPAGSKDGKEASTAGQEESRGQEKAGSRR